MQVEKKATTTNHRTRLALEATGQIEALVRMLKREHAADDGTFPEILTTTLRRINELNSVAMSVLDGDDGRETDEMRAVVHGDEEAAHEG
jgi:hypothetical protein